MLRKEDHLAFERFSLNSCKLLSLNVHISIFLSVPRVRVPSSKYAKTGKWSDISLSVIPLKTLCARSLVNMLSIGVAEYEVRRVRLGMRGRKACEYKLSINSFVGIWWLYWRWSGLNWVTHHITMFIVFRNWWEDVVEFANKYSSVLIWWSLHATDNVFSVENDNFQEKWLNHIWIWKFAFFEKFVFKVVF